MVKVGWRAGPENADRYLSFLMEEGYTFAAALKPNVSSVESETETVSVCFEESGCAHTAADAHRDYDVAYALAFRFDEGVADQSCAGHPVRMAD